MVGENAVLEWYYVATIWTDEPVYLFHLMDRKESHMRDTLILRPERHLARHAPEGWS